MPIKPGKSISPTSVTLIGCQSDMPLERLGPRSSSPMSSPVKWYRDSRESDFPHSTQQSSHQHSHWQASKALYLKVLYQSLRCDCGTLLNSLWWSFCCYIRFCYSYTAMVCQENKGSSQQLNIFHTKHRLLKLVLGITTRAAVVHGQGEMNCFVSNSFIIFLCTNRLKI